MKKKEVAGILALLLGPMGVHRFYLGRRFQGILHLFLFAIMFMATIEEHAPFIMIPAILGFIDAVLFFAMPKEEFDERYNKKYLARDYGNGYYDDRQPARSQLPAPGEEKRFKQAGVRFYRMKDYNNAIESFLTALDIRYDDPVTHFNVACCFSLNGEFDDAFHHLEKAVEFGFNQIDKIHNHPALDNLRLQPGFHAFVQNKYRQPDKIGAGSFGVSPPPTFFDIPAQPDGAATATEVVQNDLLDQLIRLGELREKGILTEEEFSSQKQKLLRD